MQFILDASIALAWHFEDESSALADAIAERCLDERVIVPRHWHAEVTNGLLSGERRKRTAPDRVAFFLKRLALIDLVEDDMGGEEVFERILPLARAHKLTVYDALYLELAERQGVPLATLDTELAIAGRSVGIEILGA